MAMIVQFDIGHGPAEFLLGKAETEAFGEHRHTEGAAMSDALEHRGLEDVYQA